MRSISRLAEDGVARKPARRVSTRRGELEHVGQLAPPRLSDADGGETHLRIRAETVRNETKPCETPRRGAVARGVAGGISG